MGNVFIVKDIVQLIQFPVIMKKTKNKSTPIILIIASALAVLLGFLDAQTERFMQVFVGDSGANLIALIMYTSIFALLISFFRFIVATLSPATEE